MFEFLLGNGFVPFTVSLGLLFGLFTLELVSLLLGGSLFAGGDADVDGPDIGADVGPEVDGLAAPDLGDMDLGDLDLGDLDLGDTDVLQAGARDAGADALPIMAAWLGLGKMPFMIWLACGLLSFGVSGVILQSVLQASLGVVLPASLAALPAAFVAILFTRSFGGVFARVLPQNETSALSERSLGRRRGVVSQGTAARGRPAEVRVMDGHGNAHYLRAEPLSKTDEIAQGTEVLVIRDRRAQTYVLVPLSD